MSDIKHTVEYILATWQRRAKELRQVRYKDKTQLMALDCYTALAGMRPEAVAQMREALRGARMTLMIIEEKELAWEWGDEVAALLRRIDAALAAVESEACPDCQDRGVIVCVCPPDEWPCPSCNGRQLVACPSGCAEQEKEHE